MAPTEALREAARAATPGLRALACEGSVCAVADDQGMALLDPQTLELTGRCAHAPLEVESLHATASGFCIRGSCSDPAGPCQIAVMLKEGTLVPAPSPAPVEPVGPDSAAAEQSPLQAEMRAWKEIFELERRLPFRRRVPAIDNGLVSFLRGSDAGSARLMRVGGPTRSVPVRGTAHPSTCEGLLAPHPSGRELYMVVWPEPALVAYDALSLEKRWTLALPQPAQGLFVDPGGRFLLLSLTAAPEDGRLGDHPAVTLSSSPVADALLASKALPPDGPQATGVLLADLGPPEIVVQLEGAFRGWVAAAGGYLLATDQELVRLAGDP